MNNLNNKSIAINFPAVHALDKDGQIANLDDYECVTFRGVQLSETSLHVASEPQPVPELTIDEAVKSTGEFVAVFKNRNIENDYVVLTDPWGFQKLFANTPSRNYGFTVSTDPGAIGWQYRQYGLTPAVDWATLYIQLGTEHSWSSTFNTDSTALQGIQNLRPFEILHIDGDRASLVDLRQLTLHEGLSYESLIEKGVQRATKQLEVLTKSLNYAEKRINLSGGKDSRLLVALLTATGATDQYSVRTVNPRSWASAAARPGLERDLQVADTIRRRYGMRWYEDPKVTEFQLSPIENLENWLSFEAGVNFRMPIRRKLRILPNQIAELRGASGEAFRHHWSYYLPRMPHWADLKLTSDAFTNDASIMFDAFYSNTATSRDIHEAAWNKFLDNLLSMNRDTFSEAVDRHFTLFRNRAHFGTTLRFSQEGATPYFLLNQVELVAAGEMLAPEDRHAGAVFFDILETLNPELNDLEFDSNQWSKRVRARTQRATTDWGPITSKDQLDSFYKLQEPKKAANPRKQWSPVFNESNFVANETKEVLAELSELDDADEFFTPRFNTCLLNRSSANPVAGSHNLAKLHSLRRSVVGSKPDIELTFPPLGCDSPDSFRIIEPLWLQPFRPEIQTVQFRVAVKRLNPDKVEAKILLDQTNSYDLEFAFYLKVGSDVLQRCDYGPETRTILDAPQNGNSYRVQGFVKRTRPLATIFPHYSAPFN